MNLNQQDELKYIRMAIIKKDLNLKNTFISLGWIGPSLILYGLFLLYPIIFSIVLTFFKWNGYTREPFADYVGFTNFIKLVNDPLFWKSLQNNLILVFVVVVFMTSISLISALIIFFGKFRQSSLIRAIIFFPGVVSQVIIALIFRKLLNIDGLFNTLIEAVGLGNFTKAWLSDTELVIWIVSFIVVWQWIGYIMLIFHAALQSIDQNLMEAALIDGASLQRAIFGIVIPIIRPTILLSAILNFIGSFKVYVIIAVLTRGGPAHASEVLTTYMYFLSFRARGPSDMGYAATVALTLAIIIVIFAVIRIKFFKEEYR